MLFGSKVLFFGSFLFYTLSALLLFAFLRFILCFLHSTSFCTFLCYVLPIFMPIFAKLGGAM